MNSANPARLAHQARCLVRVVMAEAPDFADRQWPLIEKLPELRRLTGSAEGAIAVDYGLNDETQYVIWRHGSRYTSSMRPDWLLDSQILNYPVPAPTPMKSLQMLTKLAERLRTTAPDVYGTMALDEKVQHVRDCYAGDASRSVQSLIEQTFQQMLESGDLESQPAGAPSKDAVAAWLTRCDRELTRRYTEQSLPGAAVTHSLAAAAVHLNSFKSDNALMLRFGPETGDLSSAPVDLRDFSYEVAIDGSTTPISHRLGFAKTSQGPIPKPIVTYVFPFQLNAYLHAREITGGGGLEGVLETADDLKNRGDLARDTARRAMSMEQFHTSLYVALVFYKAALYLYREIVTANRGRDDRITKSSFEGDTICEEMRVLILSTFMDSIEQVGLDFMDVSTFLPWVEELQKLPTNESTTLISDQAVKLKCPMFVTELSRRMVTGHLPNARLQSLERLQRLVADIIQAQRDRPLLFGEPNYLSVAAGEVVRVLRLLGRDGEVDPYEQLATEPARFQA